MSLTIQQILSDAKKLSNRLKEHDKTADDLLSQTEAVYKQIDAMKHYADDLDGLDEKTKGLDLQGQCDGEGASDMQQEHRQLKELLKENRELKLTLMDYQNAVELIMSKYRLHVSQLTEMSKIDFKAMYDERQNQIIQSQAEKIQEMIAVMQKAVSLDDEEYTKLQENVIRLEGENKVLREMLKISHRYGSLDAEASLCNARLMARLKEETNAKEGKGGGGSINKPKDESMIPNKNEEDHPHPPEGYNWPVNNWPRYLGKKNKDRRPLRKEGGGKTAAKGKGLVKTKPSTNVASHWQTNEESSEGLQAEKPPSKDHQDVNLPFKIGSKYGKSKGGTIKRGMVAITPPKVPEPSETIPGINDKKGREEESQDSDNSQCGFIEGTSGTLKKKK